MSEYYLTKDGELMHYGVLGMKWGVHRSNYKYSRNPTLRKKAAKYDLKSAKNARKASKLHNKIDLEGANRLGVKAEKYQVKSSSLARKALKADNEDDKLRLQRKSAKKAYKAAKLRMESEKLDKSVGYGSESMKYLTKSKKFAKKAAKARLKISKNDYYINRMKKKISKISKEDLQDSYSFVNDFLKDKKK